MARNKSPSDNLSNSESRKAPNLVVLLVFLARAPSNISKRPATRIVTPAAINKPRATKTDSNGGEHKTMMVSVLGLTPVLAIRLTGVSVK